jgi:hypothetical protein
MNAVDDTAEQHRLVRAFFDTLARDHALLPERGTGAATDDDEPVAA